MPDANRTALTYRYERWRAISSGILETAGGTFLLLIAVRWYHAGAIAKALVAGGGSFGLMLGPWLVARVETAGWPVAQAAARVAGLGALGFVIMALVPAQPVFVVGAVVTMAASAAAVPLMTQIYQEHYPEYQRGRLFSRAFMIRIGNGGGDVAWGLWVTKFAPPEQVADDMSVHTFFTGLRGVLAPVAAFQLVGTGRWRRSAGSATGLDPLMLGA